MRIAIWTGFCSLALATVLPAQSPTDRTAWLAGCWQSVSGTRATFEMWSPPGGGIMVGAGRTVVDGRARAFEHLRLSAAGDTLIFTASPSGQAQAAFRSTVLTDTSFVVENPAHDFPTRLSYTRLTADAWVARVEGPGPSGPRSFSQVFSRVRCDGGS